MNEAIRQYLKIYAALIFLLFVTVGVSYLPLEPFTLSIALVIAAVKAILVAAIFMHLRGGDRLNWLVGAGALVWLVILIIGPFADFLFRRPL